MSETAVMTPTPEDQASAPALASNQLGLLLEPVEEIRLTGLTLAKNCSFDEWSRTFLTIYFINRADRWLLGDLLNLGEDRWPENWVDFIQEHGHLDETLMTVAFVARHYPEDFRHPHRSWAQHHVLIDLVGDPEDCYEWLERSSEEGWSKTELVKHVRAEIKTQATQVEMETDVEPGHAEFDYGSKSLETLGAELRDLLTDAQATPGIASLMAEQRAEWPELWEILDEIVEQATLG